MQTIGSRLKIIRKKKKLILKDVTTNTGINRSLLSRIENNKCKPSRKQVIILCKYYQAYKDELIIKWLREKVISNLENEGTSRMQLEEERIEYNTAKNKVDNKSTGGNMDNFLNKVIQGDCLEVMKQLPDKSINMILCDLPYGTTQNKWDSVIDLNRLWVEYERIITDNGVIVLTSQGVFTAKLILSNEKLFKYKIVWIKSKSTNFLNAKIQPLRKHEDICVFYKKQPTYNPQMTRGEAYDKGIRKDQYTGSYGDFKPRHVKSDGERYPTDIINFEALPTSANTQKPKISGSGFPFQSFCATDQKANATKRISTSIPNAIEKVK